MHIVVFAVLIPLKLWLLFWLMSQDWFWPLIGWLIVVALGITVLVLIGHALQGIAR